MSKNIRQTLLGTRCEHPIEADDIDAWVERLTNLREEVEPVDERNPSLLTDREAEVLIRYCGTHQDRQEIADELGVSPSRVDNLRRSVEEKLLAADATLGVVGEFRREIRPDPYD